MNNTTNTLRDLLQLLRKMQVSSPDMPAEDLRRQFEDMQRNLPPDPPEDTTDAATAAKEAEDRQKRQDQRITDMQTVMRGLTVQQTAGLDQGEDPIEKGIYPEELTGVIPVKVWQDGGTTDGDASNPCNRTYTVRSLAATAIDTGGILLGEDMTPEKRRPATGKLSCASATGTGTVGLGYYDTAHAFKLYDANETTATGACA